MRTEGVKWRIVGTRDNATALNVSQTIVSRLRKKHRQNGSANESKRSTLILECQELSLKCYGMWCIFLGSHAAVKGSKRDFELSKVLERNSGI